MDRLIIYCEHIKGFINMVFCGEFLSFDIIIFLKKRFLLVLIKHGFAMEYAIHTHYTQFFWNFNWTFKPVTWTWNRFIFQFWKLLFWNRKFILWFWIFLFQCESSYLNSENYYLNLKTWFWIMQIIIWNLII